jgi:hypothetical protein
LKCLRPRRGNAISTLAAPYFARKHVISGLAATLPAAEEATSSVEVTWIGRDHVTSRLETAWHTGVQAISALELTGPAVRSVVPSLDRRRRLLGERIPSREKAHAVAPLSRLDLVGAVPTRMPRAINTPEANVKFS